MMKHYAMQTLFSADSWRSCGYFKTAIAVTNRCLAVQTFDSGAQGGQANPLLRPGQPGSIIYPCSSQALVPSNYPLQNSQLDPTHLGCQPPNCCTPPHLLPSKIHPNNVLLTTKGPVYLGAFNVRTLSSWTTGFLGPNPLFPTSRCRECVRPRLRIIRGLNWTTSQSATVGEHQSRLSIHLEYTT